jgi:hypothetical protein
MVYCIKGKPKRNGIRIENPEFGIYIYIYIYI